MKRRELMKRYLVTMCLSAALVTTSITNVYGAGLSQVSVERHEVSYSQTKAETVEDDTTHEANEVVIHDVDEFLVFVDNCRYDSFSLGKTVSLAADLDLTGVVLEGISYFNGTFDGNNHTISNLRLKAKGSDYGLFRYIGASGTVKNLRVSGVVQTTGSQENIGGIVGVNMGVISDCFFEGKVEGIDSVGGIAGLNEASGTIISCSNNALVLATNDTGGIVGINHGVVSECMNQGSINIEELEATLDLAGMDVSSFNMTQTVITRNNMGGVAGSSTGLITDSKNEGLVGYKHTGYNAGGIVGSQCGVVINCSNQGEIYGRKDVGGIVGQAEPYVESEYLNDKVDETKSDINRLNRTLGNISSTMSSTSKEVRDYADSLDFEYDDSVKDISGNLNQLTESVDTSNPANQEAVDNINASWNQIQNIQSSGSELTDEQRQEIRDNLNNINNNLENIQGSSDNAGTSTEEIKNSITNELNSSGRNEEIKDLARSVDNGVQSITKNMESALNQMNAIADSLSADITAITSDEKIVTDISSIETAEDMDGVISGCKNYGKIYGDLNVGGVVGTVNIEYGEDPEFDFDFSESLNITLRSTVNDVMIHCINYGAVSAKKNSAGGIAGLQELGFIYDCENYGNISSDAGSYLGGISGNSVATIEKSYSLCNIEGTDYVGGICGKGYTVKDSISVCEITSEGERIGSVAGYIEMEGIVSDNRFVSDTLHGIDNISYAGTADQVSYEDILTEDGLPNGFNRVTIVFETEDNFIAQKEIAYGGSIADADFPNVEEQEGCYVKWPETDELTDIRQNLTVTAEYVPWTESVAGEAETDNGKPVCLAIGEFYEDTKLNLTEINGPDNLDKNAVLAYAYAWSLSSDRDKSYETIELHLVKPDTEDTVHVWVNENDSWSEALTQEDGSYMVVTIPYGAAVAVVTQPEGVGVTVIVGGVAAVVLIAGFIVWHRRKNKKQGKTTSN